MSDKCPRCGAAQGRPDIAAFGDWTCGSSIGVFQRGAFSQTRECRIAELESENAFLRARRAQVAEVLDKMHKRLKSQRRSRKGRAKERKNLHTENARLRAALGMVRAWLDHADDSDIVKYEIDMTLAARFPKQETPDATISDSGR